jgi:hypothetical protein
MIAVLRLIGLLILQLAKFVQLGAILYMAVINRPPAFSRR